MGFMLVTRKLFVKKPEGTKVKAPLSTADPFYRISTYRSGAFTPDESSKPGRSGELGPSKFDKLGGSPWGMKK